LLNFEDKCIGVTLENGFYNSLPLRILVHCNFREVLKIGIPVFIGEIMFVYQSDPKEEIITDNLWKFIDGPLMKNNAYLGGVYDAKKEHQGWDQPGFDDSSWNFAVFAEGPGGSGALAVAWQADTCINDSQNDLWYEPKFTFRTSRYMEIAEFKKQPNPDDLEGVANNTNVSKVNHFLSSSILLDSIQNASKKDLLAYLVSV